MKRLFKKIALVAWIIINVLLFIGVIGQRYDQIVGNSVLVNAEVTYVREFYDRHGYKDVNSHKHIRKNGYISWVYGGELHHYEDEKKAYFDFAPDQKTGDIIKIWVRADNGKFVEADKANGKAVGCFFFLVIDAILMHVSFKKRKRKKQ